MSNRQQLWCWCDYHSAIPSQCSIYFYPQNAYAYLAGGLQNQLIDFFIARKFAFGEKTFLRCFGILPFLLKSVIVAKLSLKEFFECRDPKNAETFKRSVLQPSNLFKVLRNTTNKLELFWNSTNLTMLGNISQKCVEQSKWHNTTSISSNK